MLILIKAQPLINCLTNFRRANKLHVGSNRKWSDCDIQFKHNNWPKLLENWRWWGIEAFTSKRPRSRDVQKYHRWNHGSRSEQRGLLHYSARPVRFEFLNPAANQILKFCHQFRAEIRLTKKVANHSWEEFIADDSHGAKAPTVEDITKAAANLEKFTSEELVMKLISKIIPVD